jgi:sulfur-carrier protein adenylyltransferase/sulfurtransferase
MSLSKEELQRYSRHLLMEEFGEQAQLKLKSAKVLVVGAGGLGSPCLLYLATAGIGHLGIADDDVVQLSNLQRQVLFSTEDVGKPKAEVARQQLKEKNPLVEISTHGRITRDNVIEVIRKYDLIVDGSDNFSTRYLLNDACVIVEKPYIYGALFKFEGQVSTFNYLGGPTYRCLYPEAPLPGEVPACGEAGVLGVLPGIIGSWQAAEAIKVITGMGEPLSGKLLVINLLNNNFDVLRFKANPANKAIRQLSDPASCDLDSEIDYRTMLQWLEAGTVQLVDVREEDEFERFNIGGLNLPFSEFEDHLETMTPEKKVVCLCSSGVRSKQAMLMFKKKFPGLDVYNVRGGLTSL